MSLILISVVIVGLCVFLLSFNIIFRKDGKFPEKEVGHNKEMRNLGLKCAKSEEKVMWGTKGTMLKSVRNDTNRECSNCSNCGSS